MAKMRSCTVPSKLLPKKGNAVKELMQALCWSVLKMPDAGEHHADTKLVCGGDDIGIAL